MAERKIDFKSMTKEQKKTYIKDYYRYHIIMGCGLCMIFLYMGYQAFTKPNIIFNMAILGTSSLDIQQIVDFQNELAPVVLEQPNQKDEVSIMVYPFEETTSEVEALNNQYREKLIVQLIAGDIDLLCLDETQLNWLLEQDLVFRLNEWGDLNQFESEQYVYDSDNSNIIGIKLNKSKDNPLISCENHDIILAISATSARLEESFEVMKWLNENRIEKN